MRLKSVLKYNISEAKNSILIFYMIMLAIMLLMGVSITNVSVNNGNVNFFGGAEMASAIFLFVVGLNSFKQNYLFLSTNGITRKAQFYGFLISSLLIALVMSVIDTSYGNILSEFINYKSMFYQMYGGGVIGLSKPLVTLMSFIWSAALYLLALTLGYLITTLYYKMSKMLKIIVSIGVPALFVNIFPIIDSLVTGGKVYGWIGELFISMAGLRNGYNPLIAIVSLSIGTVILASLAFLLVRRVPVKE